MKNIKNIIFDFGNIFFDIDIKKTEDAFEKLGVKNFKSLYSLTRVSDLFEKLETGLISTPDFYDNFRKLTKSTISDIQIKDAWNALLLNYSLERIDWLEKIKLKYNIYLFSNTNQIHYDSFNETYYIQTGKKNFDDYFIKAWYSHKINMRKPHTQSYISLLKSEKLNPSETLFVDDVLINIEGAQKAGLQTFHLPPPKTVFDLPL